MRNEGKVALVTGSSSGVGLSIAEHLTASGCFVEGCSRGEGVLDSSSYQHTTVDVGCGEEVRDWIQLIQKRRGKLDIAINNAAIYKAVPLLTLSSDLAEEVMRTNFIGTLNVCREAARVMMRAKRGRIINFSSVATSMNDEHTSAYTASKCAVTGFTKVIAKELARFGITCNVVELSIFESRITNEIPEAVQQEVVNRLTVKRFANKQDLGHVIDFLVDDGGGYVSGGTIRLG